MSAAILAPGLALAQPAPKPPTEPAPAARSGSMIEEVVVTARKREENLQEIPVAVTAMSAQTLKNQSVQSLRDVQQQTPSLTISMGTSDRNSQVVTIRGQTNNDLLLTVDPAVGIYIDGVSFAKTITTEVTNLMDIDHIEVLKGPQGTLYGRNTTGGAINIFTKLPGADPAHQVVLRVGSYNRVGAGLVMDMPIQGETIGLRLVGSYDKRDPVGTNQYNGQGVGGDLDGGTIRGTLRIRPTDTIDLQLRADYNHNTTTSIAWKARGLLPNSVAALLAGVQAGLGAAAGTPAGRAATAANYAAQGQTSDFWDVNQNFASTAKVYSWGTSFTGSIELPYEMQAKSISAYRTADRKTFYDLDGSTYSILHTNGYTHQGLFTQELQLQGVALDRRLNWIVGAYYSREFGFDGTQSISLGNAATRSFNEGHVVNKSAAAFTQATFKLTDQIGLTGGLRYTHEDKYLRSQNRTLVACNVPVILRINGQCLAIIDNNWNALNYTASLDYKPIDGVLIYAKTSTGFRSGGQNLRGGIDPITFTTFNPEKVKDYEVGLKSDWFDRRLRVNLAAYRTYYRDIQRIILVPGTLSPSTTVVRNAARAEINGAEAEITAVPIENLTLKVTGAITDPKYKQYRDAFGKDLSSQPFVFVPKKTYSLSAAYVVPMADGDLRMQADWAWQDRIFFSADSQFNGTNGLPDFRGQSAYGLLNARISKRVESLNAEIAVFGKNILDKKYFVVGLDTSNTALGFNDGGPGDPAIYGVELTKSF